MKHYFIEIYSKDISCCEFSYNIQKEVQMYVKL